MTVVHFSQQGVNKEEYSKSWQEWGRI